MHANAWVRVESPVKKNVILWVFLHTNMLQKKTFQIRSPDVYCRLQTSIGN
jgi:hypothetical protein